MNQSMRTNLMHFDLEVERHANLISFVHAMAAYDPSVRAGSAARATAFNVFHATSFADTNSVDLN